MSGSWSKQIEQRYCLQLPGDVRAWLDDQIWNEPGGAEFCHARTPRQILHPEPGAIWAGFMLPDTIPIIGNDYGDWLCLRIAADGTVCELLHWSHCGGDWLPYGRTLAEGLLYDAAVRLLDPMRRGFAGPESLDGDVFRLAEWARQWASRSQGRVKRFWNLDATRPSAPDGAAVVDGLVQARIAEIAVRRDRILGFLDSPLKSKSNPEWAQDIGVAWEPDFVQWLFDTSHVPVSIRPALTRRCELPEERVFAQDWHRAEREALAVIAERSDLGWAFDVAGWSAERRGELDLAVRHYLAGMQTSWFSDDTVRFRTHWFEEGYGKFAASRLAELAGHLTTTDRRDPYLNIFLDNDSKSLRCRVKQYWLGRARAARRRGDHLATYRYYYRAGWDLGLHPVTDYDEVFTGLRESATAAGTPALAEIAALHHHHLA